MVFDIQSRLVREMASMQLLFIIGFSLTPPPSQCQGKNVLTKCQGKFLLTMRRFFFPYRKFSSTEKCLDNLQQLFLLQLLEEKFWLILWRKKCVVEMWRKKCVVKVTFLFNFEQFLLNFRFVKKNFSCNFTRKISVNIVN